MTNIDEHLGPEHTGHVVQPHVAAHCGGDIYSRRKPLFSSFGEHTAVCGSSVRQAVARPRHRQSVCIHNIHVAATCRPSVLGSATMRGHMWLNKVASVLGPLVRGIKLLTEAQQFHLFYLEKQAKKLQHSVSLTKTLKTIQVQKTVDDCLLKLSTYLKWNIKSLTTLMLDY